MSRRDLRWLCLVALIVSESAAGAGGMFLPFRGVRPTARGGAFVAGADDPNALWYNPAGLVGLLDTGMPRELLVDAAIVTHDVTYQRIDSGGNTLQPVSNSAQLVPLPTIAASFKLRDNLVLGVGVLTPYAALDGYPEDGPQRYSLVSLHSTVIGILEAAIGWKISDKISIGAGVQDMILSLDSRLVFSACPGQTVCAPEDPEFDSLGEVKATTFFAPSAVLGVQAHPASWLNLGVSVQLPFSASSTGTVAVRLPSSGFFDGASVDGNQAGVAITFPAMIRVGAELRPSKQFRLEVGFDWEMWSEQESISITPKDVSIQNAAGVGTYDLGPLVVPRHFNDTYALRAGLEVTPSASVPVTLLAGFVHETGASTQQYISVAAVDTSKNVLTLGLSFRVGHTRVDATYGHVFEDDMDVPSGTSCAPQLNPIRSGDPNQAGMPDVCVHDGSPDHIYVGDGHYSSSWNIFGVGVATDF